MLENLEGITEAGLKRWIESSLAEGSNILAQGYQGQTLVYKQSSPHLVIKVPHGRGLIRRLHISMLRHEYAVYRQLEGLELAPRCFGLVDGQYLVLEFVDGVPIRKHRPQQDTGFYDILFEYIGQMHQHDVAHMDLKRKDNLLVVEGRYPKLIDFGAAVIRKNGFHPFNRFHFKLAKRFDFHAWIRHKYNKNIDEVRDDDRVYYRRTLIEIVSRKIKRFYKDYIYDWKKSQKKKLDDKNR